MVDFEKDSLEIKNLIFILRRTFRRKSFKNISKN